MAKVKHSTPHPLTKDETGNVYGKLTVLAYAPGGKKASWKCRCECGSVVIVQGANLRSGNSRSCSKACGCTRHGHSRVGRLTPEYHCWQAMRQRCCNADDKAYRNYGGRGIRVCERWKESFERFLADMGPRPSPNHSIDRIDNDGDYKPSNCRWAVKIAQDNNRRTNHFVTHDGKTKTVAQWAKCLGIGYGVLYHRLSKHNWCLGEVIRSDQAT